jgi:hypothetical protein
MTDACHCLPIRLQGDQLVATSGVVYNKVSDYGGVSVKGGQQVVRMTVQGEVRRRCWSLLLLLLLLLPLADQLARADEHGRLQGMPHMPMQLWSCKELAAVAGAWTTARAAGGLRSWTMLPLHLWLLLLLLLLPCARGIAASAHRAAAESATPSLSAAALQGGVCSYRLAPWPHPRDARVPEVPVNR